MGGEDEEAGHDCDGGVCISAHSYHSLAYDLSARSVSCRMSFGLGMSREEWSDLRAKVDDSFWVMRIIGRQRPYAFDSSR